LKKSVLDALVALNVALAQECFLIKAINDQKQDGKMKDITIAKLAAKASELYNQAFEKSEGLKSICNQKVCIF
jgi:hypothetical protein